jgi:hypothetical protein
MDGREQARPTTRYERFEMDPKRYTDKEIGEQRIRVISSESNRVFYEAGRLACMMGKVTPPKNTTTTENVQWETGWQHQFTGVDRPYEN